MDQTETKSKKKLLWVIIGIVVVLAVVGGATYALVVANEQKPTPVSDEKKADKTPASIDRMKADLTNLNTTSNNEKKALSNAQAARDDQAKRTKLSN
jgi:flagellar basal body-associated protein FliL